MKPVSELLKKRDGTLWHVRPDDTVYAALEALERWEAGALMVMERGALVGVFSERDYTAAAFRCARPAIGQRSGRALARQRSALPFGQREGLEQARLVDEEGLGEAQRPPGKARRPREG